MQKFLSSFRTTPPEPDAVRYAGLNARMLANLFDMLLVFMLFIPILFIFPPDLTSGQSTIPAPVVEAINQHNSNQISDQQLVDSLKQAGYINTIATKLFSGTIINILLFGVITLVFWKKFNSTPGKMMFKLRIVDDTTFDVPSTSQYIVRFVGYIVSSIPLGLGFFIIPLNKRRKGLHDFMANTVVIYAKPKNPEWEKKKSKFQLYIFFILLILAIIFLSNK